MKIKSGFLLHSMGNEHIVVAIEDRIDEFHGMIRLNTTGAFLWNCMEHECDEQSLEAALVIEYGITETLAKEAVASFLAQISDAGVIE